MPVPDQDSSSRQINSARQVEELARLTGELAHEIKNPLSTVKVNLKLIAEELDSVGSDTTAGDSPRRLARAKRKLTVVQKETDRLEKILEGFLRYVGRAELNAVRTDINGLVGEVVDFYYPQARSHSVTLRQSLNKSPLICKVDSALIKQVLLNLFINSQQAIDGDGEIMVRTDRSVNVARIAVSDTGRGISSDKLPRLFQPFFSSRPDGTGLGLATAKRIIEAHDGRISVASEPGKGTEFTIELPLLTEQ